MASLIAIYLNYVIFYNIAISKPRSKTTKYLSTSTSISESIRTEKEYKKIFLYVNNLNFVTNNYEIFKPHYVLKEEMFDGENGLVSHEIKESLKRASTVGITDFIIPESTIDVDNLATYQVLEALVKLSFFYNITINMLLDQQFVCYFNSKKFKSNNTFLFYSPNPKSSKEIKLVIGKSNPHLQFEIEDRIIKFSNCKIKNFYFGENPYYLVPRNDVLDNHEMVPFLCYELLFERAKFILKISDNIKLFYIFDFLPNRYNADIFRSKLRGLNYEGILIYVKWNSFYMTIFSERILTFIFQKLDTEKTVVIFHLKIKNDSVDYLDVVLGIYLFSPIPIVLMIEDKYALSLYNNILTNQTLLPHEMYAKVNNAYLWVLKIMKENPFFQNNPSLLEDVKLENDVISAISGTKENGNISGLLFLLFNQQDKIFNIDLNIHFPGWSFQTYSILYDSVPREKSCQLNKSGEINLSRQQILIIQPNLIF